MIFKERVSVFLGLQNESEKLFPRIETKQKLARFPFLSLTSGKIAAEMPEKLFDLSV